MKMLFYNLLVLIVSLIFGLIAVEIFLRADGRYADLVNENLVRSRAIFDRPASVTQYRKHPVLEYDVEIKFNDFKIRNHQGISLKDVEKFQGDIIGFFGDSMTENRRVDDRFTFISLLNESLKPDFMVLNFGVDGYGLDQSYLKFIDFKERHNLSHVFYMFSPNDLRNIYENQLFDFSGDKVGAPVVPKINPFIEIIRKFNVSYLLIDSYARLKAKAANETYASEELNDKVMNKFSQRKSYERDARYHDEYADSLAKNYLSEAPSERTLEWAKRFRLLLAAWESDVRSHEKKFTIFVTPSQISTDLARKLFGKQFAAQTVYLIEYFPEGYNRLTFKNDKHWNERGNLRAAQAIAKWGGTAKLWPDTKEILAVLTAQTETAIEKLYQQ